MQFEHVDNRLEKERVRRALIEFTRVLGTRPVTSADVRQFSRFAVPRVLLHARNEARPLSVAEKRLVVAQLSNTGPFRSMPRLVAAVDDKKGAPFGDYTFQHRSTVYPPRVRTGVINNPPFSMYAPEQVTSIVAVDKTKMERSSSRSSTGGSNGAFA